MKLGYAAICAVATLLSSPADAQDGRASVADIRRILARDYVVTDKRPAIDEALLHGLKSGRYDGVDQTALVERINADLAEAAHDGHLFLRYAPAEAASLPATPGDDDEPDPYMDEQARISNHGVTEQRVLPGNIRYLNTRAFMWAGADGKASAAALDRAMAFAREGDAIIIDLRGNGGGDPRAERHLASYFVPARTKLVTFYLRSKPPEDVYTETDIPGGRITGKPVYVLTSRQSVSAAEEFASHAVHFGFATLVGTTTRGGAYRNDLYPIAGGYVLSVSIGRGEMPGGGDWEGRGIDPKIAVEADLALDAAQASALRALAGKAGGSGKAALERRAAYHQARVTPVAMARAARSYAGTYGTNVVSVSADGLSVQRDGRPSSILVPIAPDRFALAADPTIQMSFSGNPDVTVLTLERADGRRETFARSAP